MDNHYNIVGGNVRKQTDGGRIRSDLSGETVRVYMI